MDAITGILYGDAEPGGRLPVSVPKHAGDTKSGYHLEDRRRSGIVLENFAQEIVIGLISASKVVLFPPFGAEGLDDFDAGERLLQHRGQACHCRKYDLLLAWSSYVLFSCTSSRG